MKVFYLTQFENYDKEVQKLYDLILDCLLRLNTQVISIEKGEFLSRYNNFFAGHFATLAIQARIPVLLLTTKILQIHFHFFSKYFQHINYEKPCFVFEIIGQIRKFLEDIEEYRITDQLHLQISSSHKKYIQSQANLNKATISAYMRKLIEKDIDSNATSNND